MAPPRRCRQPSSLHEFWQHFDAAPDPGPPLANPARMPEGSYLYLPIRDIGVAGLIANQARFAVLRALGAWLAEAMDGQQADAVVGLPTLGHALAPLVAEALGQPNWVAAGYSRKLWYDESLSVPIRSIIGRAERRVWLNPRLLPRLQGRHVLLVDDVVSAGASARTGLDLLAAADLRPVGLGVARIQTRRWRQPGRRTCRCAPSSRRRRCDGREAAGCRRIACLRRPESLAPLSPPRSPARPPPC